MYKNPSRPDYLVKKIGTLIRLGMYDSANESTDELLAKAPEMFDGYHIKTQLLLHDEKYEEAITFSKAASDRFPEDVDLLFDYAKSLSLANKLEEALKVINSAKKMKYFEDAKRQIILLESQIYAESNNYEQAVACCNECISFEEENEFDGEARFMLMNLYLAGNNFEKALEQAKVIINKDEEDIYYYAALYYRPFCIKQIGKVEEAHRYYKEANAIYRIATLENPAAIDIYLYRAMCLRDMEEYDKALEMLDFIEGLSDQIAEIYVIRADIYNFQGRKSKANEELQKAYAIKPELNPDQESEGE